MFSMSAEEQHTVRYKRLTQQFQDLQEKFRHFEQADDRQFREIWQLNEASVRQLITKVLWRSFLV